jgi:hypothetical protein
VNVFPAISEMGLFDEQSRKAKDTLDSAPYLFPWYVSPHNPQLFRNGIELEWTYREKIGDEYVGVITLDDSKNAFGIFRIYNYVFPSNDRSAICVWSKKQTDNKAAKALRLELYRLNDLTEIVDLNDRILSINSADDREYFFEVPPCSSVEIWLDRSDGPSAITFPVEFKSLDDFIAVVEIDNLYQDPAYHGTALLEIMPNQGLVQLHPQDWFNQDNEMDFGYQWITRAARDTKTGRIVGEGIRIGRFELDDSDRKLQ